MNYLWTKRYGSPEVSVRSRIQKGTRMPTIPDEEGRTHFTEIYAGDARRQFEAIWLWLLLGREITPVDEGDR